MAKLRSHEGNYEHQLQSCLCGVASSAGQAAPSQRLPGPPPKHSRRKQDARIVSLRRHWHFTPQPGTWEEPKALGPPLLLLPHIPQRQLLRPVAGPGRQCPPATTTTKHTARRLATSHVLPMATSNVGPHQKAISIANNAACKNHGRSL